MKNEYNIIIDVKKYNKEGLFNLLEILRKTDSLGYDNLNEYYNKTYLDNNISPRYVIFNLVDCIAICDTQHELYDIQEDNDIYQKYEIYQESPFVVKYIAGQTNSNGDYIKNSDELKKIMEICKELNSYN